MAGTSFTADQVTSIIDGAIELIPTPLDWCQEYMAADANGNQVDEYSDKVCKRCAQMAVLESAVNLNLVSKRVTCDTFYFMFHHGIVADEAEDFIDSREYVWNFADYNDSLCTRHGDVIRLLKRLRDYYQHLGKVTPSWRSDPNHP